MGSRANETTGFVAWKQGVPALGEETTAQRLALLTQITGLFLRMVPEQRGHSLRDPASACHAGDEPVPSSPDT